MPNTKYNLCVLPASIRPTETRYITCTLDNGQLTHPAIATIGIGTNGAVTYVTGADPASTKWLYISNDYLI